MRTFLFLAAIALLSLTACTPKAAMGVPMAKQVDLGERFTLKPGEAIMVEGQNGTFRFVEVSNDSRCPDGVDCLVAGEATVVVDVNGGNLQNVAVAKDYRKAKRVVSGQSVFNIISLTPAPKEGKMVSPEDYRLVVETDAL